MAVTVSTPTTLDASTVAAVRALATAVEVRDGQPPLSDRALTRLTSTSVRHVVAADNGAVVGYGQLDAGNAEIAGDAVSAAAVLDSLAPDIAEIWSHGARSVLRPLLDAAGFRANRVLHQLRRPAAVPVSVGSVADGVVVDNFVVGVDEPAWLEVNAAAFAHHPEQGGVTLDDLRSLEAESWFAPEGFFLARRDGAIIGYHWTKVHPDGAGEVYVLGVSPTAQGLGLGTLLLDIGLQYLANLGCPEVLLYVDESNAGAMHLYESVGFVRYDADTQWTH